MDALRASTTSSRSNRTRLAGLATAFLVGAALAGYGVYRLTDDTAAPPPSPAETAASVLTALTPEPSPTASETARAMAEVQQEHGGIEQRIAAAEQRIAALDLQAQAVAGNTARAEGLLIAFAARRALEKGAELGYLGDQLRLRFGDAQPQAVATIIAMSRRPVTLDQLVARLNGLAPRLAEPRNLSFGERVQGELSSLFVIRRESAPSPQPRRRLERARLFLESGRTEAAIAEVENLPGAGEAESWIADARRYAAAQNALDLIETAAVLEPRRLRDASGDQVRQPGPADRPG